MSLRRLLTALAILAAFGNGLAAPASPGAVVRAVVRPAQAAAGDLVTVEVTARNLKDAGAIAFHLVYDPSILEPAPGAATEGPALRRDGSATSFLAAPASTADRVIVGVARLGAGGGARGSGVVCRIRFRLLGTGKATLAFDRARITDPGGSALASRFEPLTFTITPRRTRPGGSPSPGEAP